MRRADANCPPCFVISLRVVCGAAPVPGGEWLAEEGCAPVLLNMSFGHIAWIPELGSRSWMMLTSEATEIGVMTFLGGIAILCRAYGTRHMRIL